MCIGLLSFKLIALAVLIDLALNSTGKTQRERVEREVGGGIGMGNTCKPMAVSFQCMTKSTTIKKIIIKKKFPLPSSQNTNV